MLKSQNGQRRKMMNERQFDTKKSRYEFNFVFPALFPIFPDNHHSGMGEASNVVIIFRQTQGG